MSGVPLVEQQLHHEANMALSDATENGLHIPYPVWVNVLATRLAIYTVVSIYHGQDKEFLAADMASPEVEEMRQEAFKRIMDAIFSMEDYDARKMPWRFQSTKMKKPGNTILRTGTDPDEKPN